MSRQFGQNLKDRLPETPNENLSVNEQWTSFRNTMTEACEQTIGYETKHNEDWFDDNDAEINQALAHQPTRCLFDLAKPQKLKYSESKISTYTRLSTKEKS